MSPGADLADVNADGKPPIAYHPELFAEYISSFLIHFVNIDDGRIHVGTRSDKGFNSITVVVICRQMERFVQPGTSDWFTVALFLFVSLMFLLLRDETANSRSSLGDSCK